MANDTEHFFSIKYFLSLKLTFQEVFPGVLDKSEEK